MGRAFFVGGGLDILAGRLTFVLFLFCVVGGSRTRSTTQECRGSPGLSIGHPLVPEQEQDGEVPGGRGRSLLG